MEPWVVDLAKEMIVSLLIAGVTWIARSATKLRKDVNCSFKRIRRIERHLGIEFGETISTEEQGK